MSGFGFGGYGFGPYDSGPSPIDFSDAVVYYVNLLIIQYRAKSNARNTVGVLTQEGVADGIVAAVRDGFDINTAVGLQIDLLGTYRGAVRTVFGLDLTHSYFATPVYGEADADTVKGFAFYGDVITWFFLQYADAVRPIYSMNDDELRRLIKFRAESQSRFLSLQEIDNILFEFFGTNVTLTDNGDMSITYTHNIGDSDTLFGIVKDTNSLPSPAGVLVIVA